MEVYFAKKKLGDSLRNDKLRVRAFGDVVADRIRLRLGQMAAAETLEVMRHYPGGCHELREDRAGQLAVDLTRNLRLVFKPTADPPPVKDDGGLDWTSVTEITILEVTDYHGA